MKPLTDSQYAFKAAVRRAVKMAGGPHAAADVVRVDAPRLSRYGNSDAPEFAPVDVCFELDRAAGDSVILRAWADLCGFELTPRNVDGKITDGLTAAAGQIARGSGELVSDVIEAGSSGVTPAKARQIDEAASDLEGEVVHIREAARKLMGGAR